jgi:hypothetical protein
MKATGFPFYACLPLVFPPSRSVSRRPFWAGARGDNLLVGPGTPRGRNADKGNPLRVKIFLGKDLFCQNVFRAFRLL